MPRSSRILLSLHLNPIYINNIKRNTFKTLQINNYKAIISRINLILKQRILRSHWHHHSLCTLHRPCKKWTCNNNNKHCLWIHKQLRIFGIQLGDNQLLQLIIGGNHPILTHSWTLLHPHQKNCQGKKSRGTLSKLEKIKLISRIKLK